MVDGLLVIDKQKGWGSYDVVAFLRRAFDITKVGHAGTLDPLATGVLLVASGKATRMLEFLTVHEKMYETVICLGKTSTTLDAEGEITETSDRIPSLEEVTAVLEQFRGEITQIPPIFSAIRVGGQRAYDIARSGGTAEMPSRTIEIKELTLLSYEYPYLSLRVACSKGTYIRTLGSDIGEALGVGGYLSDLRRTVSGPFSVQNALVLTKHTPKEDIMSAVIPVSKVQLSLPSLVISKEQQTEVLHGRKFANTSDYQDGQMISLHSENGDLCAVARISHGAICVYKNFM